MAAIFSLIENTFFVQMQVRSAYDSEMRRIQTWLLVQHVCAGTEKTRKRKHYIYTLSPGNTHTDTHRLRTLVPPLALAHLRTAIFCSTEIRAVFETEWPRACQIYPENVSMLTLIRECFLRVSGTN